MNLHQHISQNKNCIICDNQLSFLFSDRKKSYYHNQDAISVKFELIRKFNKITNFNYYYDYNFTLDNNFYLNFYKENELLHDKIPLFLIKNIINNKKNYIKLYKNCQHCKRYTACYSINLNWKLSKVDSIDLEFETFEINESKNYKIFNSHKENYTYVSILSESEANAVKFPLIIANKDLDTFLNKINSYLLLK